MPKDGPDGLFWGTLSAEIDTESGYEDTGCAAALFEGIDTGDCAKAPGNPTSPDNNMTNKYAGTSGEEFILIDITTPLWQKRNGPGQAKH
jgi:hypothetical protein